MALIPAPTHIADKSALARADHPDVWERIKLLLSEGLLATCSMIDMEVLFSCRNRGEFEKVRWDRALAYRRLDVVQDDFERAISVMGELSKTGHHRAVSLPDLIIAAIAERHHVTVLHYDADYDHVGKVTGQPMAWIVPRGSL